MTENESQLNYWAKAVSELFTSERLTLAVAESFTGGTVASSLVEIAGASSYLTEGVVCYSNAAKTLRLGVKAETLDRHGAVSEATAREMVKGVLCSVLKPDFAVATTGNAGPGTEEKSEPGEAYVAVGCKYEIAVIRLNLIKTRKENIADGAVEALKTLVNFVKNQKG